MKKTVLLIILSLVIATLLIIGTSKNIDDTNGIVVSGRIEADIINVSSLISGKIIDLKAEEGTKVKKGDILAQIDQKELKEELNRLLAKKQQIEKAIAASKKEIDIYKTKKKQTTLKKEKLENNVHLLIKMNEEKIESAKNKIAMLKNKKTVVQKNFEKIERDLSRFQTLYKEKAISKNKLEEITLKYNSIKSELDNTEKEISIAKTTLSTLKKELARTKLSLIDVKILNEEIKNIDKTINIKTDMLQKLLASKKELNSLINQIKIKLSYTEIKSPTNGIVMTKNVELGENIVAYTPLFTIYDPKKVYFKGFIPESYLSKIKIGESVKIYLDGIKRKFDAKISFVSEQAEFTPKEVQTKEERVKQVFGIKAYFDNPEPLLKPGMPADMIIDLQK